MFKNDSSTKCGNINFHNSKVEYIFFLGNNKLKNPVHVKYTQNSMVLHDNGDSDDDDDLTLSDGLLISHWCCRMRTWSAEYRRVARISWRKIWNKTIRM